ncbi:MAG: HAMP domain-containing protein [Thermoanaerobaculaceae bacterium]|nr:HAMP domain-containing protein [Thermoanaerobaculaceae bacterium]MDI9622083.1 ATP-binding protein [Acidobacteriota bacterium]NLH11560.1 HAMP domain-containing protein [Holophagae bacterium]HPW54574.1 ATP-binding protein [Thermoanaerobaculaceae bacterium]
MRSLFARIFVWLWLAMLSFAVLLVVSSPFFTRSRASLERWQRNVEEHLSQRAEEVATRIAQGENWQVPPADHHGRFRPLPVFVMRPDGSPVDGPEPPSEVVELARRIGRTSQTVSERSGMFHMVGRATTAPDGSPLIAVSAARRPPRLVDLLDPAGLSWRLGVLTALVGIVCYWLARQLAAPVAGLQTVARRLAAGDLAARVDPRVEARRDEIGTLAREFNTMADRIDTLVSAQRRLVRDVSHELRSPLARIRVALELARRRAGSEAIPILDRLEAESDRLDHLIGQLLELSRLESGGLSGGTEPVDLAELATEIAEDAGFEASSREVAVIVDSPGPVVVSGHREALRGAVDNVVRNAIAYTPGATKVRIRVEAQAGWATVTVSDCGPGVPEQDLASVFEPFFRVEEARERGRGGAGLGLAITARAAALHGGSATAANRAEGGLEVILRFPAQGNPVGCS